jgi:hypothetical protein
VAGTLWGQSIERDRQLRTELSSNPLAYPGAAVHLDRDLTENLPALPIYPDTTTVARDTVDQTRECNVLMDGAEVITCEFGDLESEYTIALVGSSHARHWFQALRTLADQHGWRLVTMTKNACQFSPEVQQFRGSEYTECAEWNENVMVELAALEPDTVFTLASLTSRHDERQERVPDGFVERWYQLEEMGIDVVAIRDTPRFSFRVPDCIDRKERSECSEPRTKSMAERAPYKDLTDLPHNTRFLDLTDYLCQDDVCHGVIGNQLVFYDNNHFSYAFSQSLAMVMEPYLLEAIGHTLHEDELTLFDIAMSGQENELVPAASEERDGATL